MSLSVPASGGAQPSLTHYDGRLTVGMVTHGTLACKQLSCEVIVRGTNYVVSVLEGGCPGAPRATSTSPIGFTGLTGLSDTAHDQPLSLEPEECLALITGLGVTLQVQRGPRVHLLWRLGSSPLL